MSVLDIPGKPEKLSVDFTEADVTAEVLRLAREHPTAKYRNEKDYCSYVCGFASDATGWSEKGCIFGQALINLGVAREDLERIEVYHIMANIDRMARYLGLKSHVMWSQVQILQDSRKTWDESVKPLVEYELGKNVIGV